MFTLLDDFDIFASMKVWTAHPDKVLRLLSQSIVNRRLFKIEMLGEPFENNRISMLQERVMASYGLSHAEVEHFVFSDSTSNYMYHLGSDNINILFKDGRILDIAKASDQLNITLLAEQPPSIFCVYPKEFS